MDINAAKRFEPIEGKWYITKELGSGAYGTVFEIVRKDFGDMKSALKIISIPSSLAEYESFKNDNFGLDDQSITSYYRGFVEEVIKECQVMAKLRGHSNIVSYEDHDVIERKDQFGWDILIRMELLNTITTYFAKEGLTKKKILKLGVDICRALEVCKEYNIIHRDIKPSNIFVSNTGDFKLGDFGVARTLEKAASGLSKKGTYTYMAPEVFKGEKYGANVDIYSLGIVLYRFLNNNLEPFATGERTAKVVEQALARRMRGEPIPAIPDVEKNISDIILKACAYNPDERWQDPKQMRVALEKELSAMTDGEEKAVTEKPSEVKEEKRVSGAGGFYKPDDTSLVPPVKERKAPEKREVSPEKPEVSYDDEKTEGINSGIYKPKKPEVTESPKKPDIPISEAYDDEKTEGINSGIYIPKAPEAVKMPERPLTPISTAAVSGGRKEGASGFYRPGVTETKPVSPVKPVTPPPAERIPVTPPPAERMSGAPAPIPMAPTEKKRTMKWYKVLVKFSLIFNGIMLMLSGISCIVEPNFNIPGGENIAFNIAWIACGVLPIIAQRRLSKFKKEAPKFLALTQVLVLVCICLPDFVAAFGGGEDEMLGEAIFVLVWEVVYILMNRAYFKKREDLFVN